MQNETELVERLAAVLFEWIDNRAGRKDAARAILPIIEEREIAARAAGAADMHARVKAELHKCGDPCTRCHDAIAVLEPKP